ncbi:MAG: barstar family protein [Candidatus Thiodiazotropha sp.]
MKIVKIEGKNITDWCSFFGEFDRVFGFPEWFNPQNGNMDGWIDCMSSLDDPEDGMTKVHCKKGSVLVIHIEDAAELKQRCPEQFEAMVDCAAFVNWRLIEVGENPVLSLSYDV